jgi:IS5 family transposase
MRKAMESQLRLDCQAVADVALNPHCRDEIVPILAALQHLYTQPAIRDELLEAVGKDVNKGSSSRLGRRGMDYWPILVLASVRLGCDLDYDKLQNLAEEHRSLRQVMGVGDWEEQARLDWRRIHDNVVLVSPQTLEQVSRQVVALGHQLVPDAVKAARADSFVVETDIHYPTESTLIRDGLRKIFQIGAVLAALLGLAGWRQHRHLSRRAKRLTREIERIASRKGPGYQQRMKGPYRQLLELAEKQLARAEHLCQSVPPGKKAKTAARSAELLKFVGRTRQVCRTATRRVLNGEAVENSQKLFSVFEAHTQLYKRGKAGEPVQFGRQVLVYEDAAGFILQATVMPRDEADRDVIVGQTRALQQRLNNRIERASFDRGFHSPENQQALEKIIPNLCLPKPGAKQSKEQEGSATVEFRQSRRRHPGVESAINALQSGNGMKRCRDHTEQGLERYVQLGVLGRNLHTLGKILLGRRDAKCEAAASRRRPYAA